MISQISGTIVQRTEQGLLIDVHGLCYEVLVPAAILQAMNGQARADGTVRLVTFHYHHVEPSRATPMLIGFTNEVEREFFERFITVSGVGPRAALRAISQPIPLIARAIDEGDLEFLRRLPGIGPQRAREIVAKLQGKVGKFGLIQSETASAAPRAHHDVAEEAVAVLLQLQYKPAEAKAMIQKAVERMPGVATAEELLNEVYRQRSAVRRGFTLMELLIVVVVLGLLAAAALPVYFNSIEKSRGAEVYGTFGFVRAGYLALKDRGIPGNWNPGIGASTDGDWQLLGVENPNGSSRAYFAYDVLRTGDGGLSGLGGERVQAARRSGQPPYGTYTTSVDNTRYIEMNLDTGEIRKSAPY